MLTRHLAVAPNPASSYTAAVAGMLLLLQIMTATCFAEGDEKEMHWQRYLSVVGDRIGYQFTIEVFKYRGDEPSFLNVLIIDDGSVQSLDALLKTMSKELPRFEIVRNARHKHVLHVIERGLKDLDGYALNDIADLQYKGPVDGVARALHENLPALDRKSAGDWREMFDDNVTSVRINATDESVRDILTDCLPLDRYGVLLWRAQTDWHKPEPTTTVQYYGPRKAKSNAQR
jgi:hypothetical protein